MLNRRLGDRESRSEEQWRQQGEENLAAGHGRRTMHGFAGGGNGRHQNVLVSF
jgi:hypothetical protein